MLKPTVRAALVLAVLAGGCSSPGGTDLEQDGSVDGTVVADASTSDASAAQNDAGDSPVADTSAAEGEDGTSVERTGSDAMEQPVDNDALQRPTPDVERGKNGDRVSGGASCPPELAEGCGWVEVPQGGVGAPCGPNANIACKPVEVPAFRIDVFEMTVSRFNLLQDGTTTPLANHEPQADVDIDAAREACQAADGRLCTFLEWYRAAYGASDSETDVNCVSPTYPWGENEPTLARAHYASDAVADVTATPSGASVFGVRNMVANVSEFIEDSLPGASGYPTCERVPSSGNTLEPLQEQGHATSLGCDHGCQQQQLDKLRAGFISHGRGARFGGASIGFRCCYDVP